MLENLRIAYKVLLGFAIIIGMSLALSVVFLIESQSVRTDVAESNRLSEQRVDTQLALSSVRLARVRGWSYLATGDATARSEMDANFQEYDRKYALLISKAKSAEGRKHFEALQASVVKLRDEWKILAALKERGVSLSSPEFVAAIDKANAVAKVNTSVTEEAEAFYAAQGAAAINDAELSTLRCSWVAGLGGLAVLVLGSLSAYVIGVSISRPITAVTKIMLSLAHGDKSVAIPDTARRDEIGGMFGAVTIFKENTIRAERLAAEKVAEQAAKEARGKKIEALNDAFGAKAGNAIGILASASTELQATAGGMARMSSSLAEQSQSATSSANDANNNVATVAAATEELYSSIQEITRQVSQSTVITAQAVSEANQTGETIRGLVEASDKIGEVVNMITNIASQTNLLALNATIEAARAGDAGKGFAVVANEVKHLANQTAKATGDIAGQITSMQNVTKEAVAAINRIDQTISAIDEITSAIAAAVEQQGAATKEIARNVEQASSGTSAVTRDINQMGQAAIEAQHASAELLSAATELGTQSELLRGEINLFLSEMRAA